MSVCLSVFALSAYLKMIMVIFLVFKDEQKVDKACLSMFALSAYLMVMMMMIFLLFKDEQKVDKGCLSVCLCLLCLPI